MIISDELTYEQTQRLLAVLRMHKKVIGYTIDDLKGISPAFCTHRIHLEDQHKLVVEHQRRLSHAMRDAAKKEVIRLLNDGIIYHVPNSEWVNPVHYVPKKGGLTMVENEKSELTPQRTVTGFKRDGLIKGFKRMNSEKVTRSCCIVLGSNYLAKENYRVNRMDRILYTQSHLPEQ